LAALERHIAETGEVLTEAHVSALEKKQDDDIAHGEVETAHPGYLGSQDTFYVGTIKGVGRMAKPWSVPVSPRRFSELYFFATDSHFSINACRSASFLKVGSAACILVPEQFVAFASGVPPPPQLIKGTLRAINKYNIFRTH